MNVDDANRRINDMWERLVRAGEVDEIDLGSERPREQRDIRWVEGIPRKEHRQVPSYLSPPRRYELLATESDRLILAIDEPAKPAACRDKQVKEPVYRRSTQRYVVFEPQGLPNLF